MIMYFVIVDLVDNKISNFLCNIYFLLLISLFPTPFRI